MSYIITTTSGNILLTLADGTTDSSTGVTLIGKNYTNYGLSQNDNFVRLVENFASTIPPNQSVGTTILAGTLWYDTGNALIKVYDGNNFSPVSGRQKSNTSPIAKNIGDQWWDTFNNQLNSWTGNSWQLVGPTYTSGQGQTGLIVGNIAGTDLLYHSVVETFVSNIVVSTTSSSQFTPTSSITGIPTVYAGITIANTFSLYGNNASFSGNLLIGVATANVINSNSLSVVANIASGNISSGKISASQIYDNSNRVVSSVNFTAGAGIAIVGNTNTGPSVTGTLINSGVISIIPGYGLNGNVTSGNISLVNTGVTSATAGIGVSLSSATGNIQIGIGQDVSISASPTFNGLYLSGSILPTSNLTVSLGSPSNWYQSIDCLTYNGNTFNGFSLNGNNLIVSNTASVNGNISVLGNALIAGTTIINGNTSISGSISINGTINCASGITTNQINSPVIGNTGTILSGNLNSSVTGVTQPIGTNTAQVATTSYVQQFGFGIGGQNWQNVTGSRALGSVYTNNTGRPIMVMVDMHNTSVATATATINGSITLFGSTCPGPGIDTFISFIVPSGSSYSVTGNAGTPTLVSWAELR